MSFPQAGHVTPSERTRAQEWLALCCALLIPLGLTGLGSAALLLIALATGDAPLTRFSYGGLAITGIAALLCLSWVAVMLAVMAQPPTPARHC